MQHKYGNCTDAFAFIFFTWLHEVKECMWDFRCSGMLRCVTSQKSKDLIYRVPEAWKHANSKYVLLFDSAFHEPILRHIVLYFCGGFQLHLFVCSAISWKFYRFLKLWCVSLSTFLLLGDKALISWNISLLFVFSLLFYCFVEITCMNLKTGCESDVYNCYICIIPKISTWSW